ncbi:MAG: hypothetical protein CMN56_01315 [Sneathiella sp.]|uniref:hypothetical protein n=1 Tax=Sneathiella sp. TaxID=1964365 RepID=UPI000C67946B|nr:hypothetical protein [Sneathiella sp.]MAZ01754.1 hypothetical protein [Sneathiella sp.]
MSVHLQKTRFAAILMGLIIGAAVALGPAASKTGHAVPSSTDCLKPLSTQEQATCNEEQQAAESGFGTLVAWLFPSTEDKVVKTGELALSTKTEKNPSEGALSSGSLSTTGLMLFGAALVGIAYLGRRRRRSLADLRVETREKSLKK